MKNLVSLAAARYAGTILLAICMAALIGCGSTKVYTADKTVVYRDSIYNMSTVKKIGAREEARTPGGEVVSLKNKDKNELKDFFKENPGSMVSLIIDLDEQEMVYLRMEVDSYSEYSRLHSRYESALKELTKFMGDKKKNQLQLK
jgi:hypothetical protein